MLSVPEITVPETVWATPLRTAGSFMDANLRAGNRILQTESGQETVEQFVRADVFLTDRYDFGQEWFHLVGIGEFQVAL